MQAAPRVQRIVDMAAQEALRAFAPQKLASNQLAITLVDLTEPGRAVFGSFRGQEQTYPASVVKLFYLVAAHRWMEDGKLTDSEELRRAMKDMIVDSLNEATGYVVDALTDTTSGPELPPVELGRWYEKRNAVNRYYTALGFTHINVNRKPWCEGPYGREMQSVQVHKPNHRNWLTTEATARLLAGIATRRAVTPERSDQMMGLLQRRWEAKPGEGESQATGFTALGLPSGARLWSKAGWTTQTRHDAAYVELSNGAKFVLVTFTTDHATEKQIIPAVAKAVIRELEK